MIRFHGKPFAEYLVEMLAAQGFEQILFLLGYLPQAVQEYFGDGKRWGVSIQYEISDVDALTGTRVQLANARLDDCFLLLYCDNYWPLQMDRMWERFRASTADAMVTVYRNRDRTRKDNVRIGPEGAVEVYDRTRSASGLQGVEIGYAIIAREALRHLPDRDVLFEEAIYPKLIAENKLIAYETDHRYYSVGSHDRLALTEAFLKRRPAIMLDRDGVLNKRAPKGEYVCSAREFEWLPGAREALHVLTRAGYLVIVISNQAGIARGAMTLSDLADIHERMRQEAIDAGGSIEAVYYCPHHWDDGCDCRKPKPGMLWQAQRDYHLDLSRTLMVGDDERDIQASDAAGCPSILVTPSKSLIDVVRQVVPVSQLN